MTAPDEQDPQIFEHVEGPARPRGGMNSERLSARERQPGHDQTFRASEKNFIDSARSVLDPELYTVNDHPRDLAQIFHETLPGHNSLGVIPEASIVSKRTKRQFFVEVKKQGDRGNAEERAAKHHTIQFYNTLKDKYGYDYHPFVTIMCESLATNRRYTLKSEYLFESDHYFNWVAYDIESLRAYLNGRCAAWLD